MASSAMTIPSSGNSSSSGGQINEEERLMVSKSIIMNQFLKILKLQFISQNFNVS